MCKMKKICSLITVAIMSTTVFISSANASAISSGFTANTNSVEVGQSFTVNVILTDVAAWNVHVSASGPVSGCSLAVADATPDAMNTTKSFSATCNAIDEGTIVVSLSGDATNQDMVNNSISGTVNVVAHAALPQQIEEPTNNQPENPSADLPSNPTNSSSSNTSNEAQSNTSSLVHSNSNNQSSSSVDTVDSNTQTSVDDQKDNEVLTGREIPVSLILPRKMIKKRILTSRLIRNKKMKMVGQMLL